MSSFSFQTIESWSPALILVTAALVFLAVRLYRQITSSERGSTNLLLGLRLLAIALLVVLLLEPVLSLFAERSDKARIAVLVDHSLSMTIPFPYDNGDDNGDGERPEAEAANEPTRASRLSGVLGGSSSGLLEELEDEGALDVYVFGGALTPVTPAKDSIKAPGPPEDRTNLARALNEGVGALGRKTGALVLFSDGSHNVGVDPRHEARRLGVPVYAVGVGSEGSVTDLSVFDVAASGVAYLDNDVPIVAKVRARGDAATDVPVYLSEGDAVLDSTRVSLPGGGVETEVELRYTPTQEGLHRYRVWTPDREGEISASNNEHLFAVRILKEKIKVLLVASRPSFDYTFLKRALESDVSLRVDPVVLSLARFPGRLGKGGLAFPAEYSDLALYDLVILLDAGAASIETQRLEMVSRFVTERGGALLVMGPPRAFDLAGTPLADILPVVPPRGTRSRTGQILPGLTESGRTHPVTQLESDPVLNESLWQELPPLGVAPVFLQRRPNARVLVHGIVDGIPRPELPLVATSVAGSGRVLTVSGSPYWRWDLYLWGTGRSGDLFRRFVSRSVRWLVARDELKQVAIRPGKSLFDGAETVIVEGQLYDDDFRPIAGADVRATVRGPLGTVEQKAREISLVDLGEGRYRGTLPGLPPGDYRIEGAAGIGGTSLGRDESEMTVAPYRMEFEDPAPNFELLRELARESGGGFFLLDEARNLPDALRLEPVVDRSVREFPLLESPLLFLALLALLGSEWALRRSRGLP